MDQEKRSAPRVTYDAQVTLLSSDSQIISEVSTRDISLSGMFVSSDKKLPIGTLCDIEILLTQMPNRMPLSQRGRVVRQEEDGMGIEFEMVGPVDDDLKVALEFMDTDIS